LKAETVVNFVLMRNLRFFQRCYCWRLKTSGTLWTGKYLPMFRKCVLPTSSGPSSSPTAVPFDPEDAGRPSHWRVWKYLPKDSSPYLRIFETLNWWCFENVLYVVMWVSYTQQRLCPVVFISIKTHTVCSVDH